MKTSDFRRGYVRMELTGSRPERFFNLCSMNRVCLRQVDREEQCYRFQASCQDLEELSSYARKADVRLILCEERSTRTVWQRMKKRICYLSGILICAGLLSVLSQSIWIIRFEGNSKYTSELLQKTLYANGYHTGMLKSRIDSEALEMLLRETYPEINWVSVEISGEVMTVQIKENSGVLTVEETDDSPCDLVAAADGTILSIVTRAGTPCVSIGDTVSAGDILVSGAVELYNDSGEQIGVNLTHADADIIAVTTSQVSGSFPLLHSAKWYTGNCRYQLSLTVFGVDLFLDGNIRGPSRYDTVIESGESIQLLGFTLPVSWEKYTLTAYEEIEGIYSQAQAEEKAGEYLEQIFSNLMEKGVQITEKNVRIEVVDDVCLYEADLTLEESIGAEQAIDESQYTREDTIGS